jgi:hypothetical protein
MPAKKTAPVKKTSDSEKTSTAETPAIGRARTLGPKGTIAIMLAVLAGGILVAARQQSMPRDAQPMTMNAVTTEPAKMAGPAIASSAPTAASPAAATGTVVAKAPVTLTGCLVQSDDTFRLKDTAGTAAPKARSWKSAFLKKGSASVEVVDPAHLVTLRNHVGHRVSVTGMLVDREMRVRSVRRVAASCDERQGL